MRCTAVAHRATPVTHRAQYTKEEQAERASFGDSSIDDAVDLATEAGVGELMLFHHDFKRTDDELDQIVSGWSRGLLPVTAARQDATWELARDRRH